MFFGIVSSSFLVHGNAGAAWRTFTNADGLLPNSQVAHIAADDRGGLWALSPISGIQHYDGSSWTYWGPAPPRSGFGYTGFIIDHAERLWVADMVSGVWRSEANSWKRVDVDVSESNGARDLDLAPDGSVWVTTHSKIVRVSDTDSTQSWVLPSAGGLARSAISPSGSVWCVSAFAVLRHLVAGTWLPVETSSELLNINDFAAGPESTLWFGTAGGGIFRKDESGWTRESVFGQATTSALVTVDRRSSVWVALPGVGVAGYEKGFWRKFGAELGWPGGSLSGITVDAIGNVWILSSGAITVFDRSSTQFARPGPFDETTARAFAQDDSGHVYAGVRRGLLKYTSPDSVVAITNVPNGGRYLDLILALVIDRSGALWSLGQESIVRWNLRTGAWTDFSDDPAIPPGRALCGSMDSTGAIWVGLDNGVVRWNGSRWESPTEGGGPDSTQVSAISTDPRGTVWLATATGPWAYDASKWTPGGIPLQYTSGFQQTVDGSMYAYGAGLSLWSASGWVPIPLDPRLQGTRIYSATADTRGSLWLVSEAGLHRLRDGVWGNLHGYRDLPIDAAVAFADSDGRLWLGSGKSGVAVHWPDEIGPTTRVVSSPPAVTADPTLECRIGASHVDDELAIRVRSRIDLQSSVVADASILPLFGLAEGPHQIELWAVDPIGNLAAISDTVRFAIDRTPPVPRIGSPWSPVVHGDSLSLSIVLEEANPDSVTVTLHSPAGSSEVFRGSVMDEPLDVRISLLDRSDEIYTVGISAVDAAGNRGASSSEFELDREFPAADVTSPVPVDATRGGQVYSVDGTTSITLPPGSLAGDATVSIDPCPECASLAGACLNCLKGVAYRVRTQRSFLRPAVLELHPSPNAPIALEEMSVFADLGQDSIAKVGGTLDPAEAVLRVPISMDGLYFVARSDLPGTMIRMVRPGIRVSPKAFHAGQVGGVGQARIELFLEKESTVDAAIYNRAGRRVRQLTTSERLPAGNAVVVWDGRADRGDLVEDGVYFVHVSVEGTEQVLSVAVIK